MRCEDFDSSPGPDLAVATDQGVRMLWNDGTGVFEAPGTLLSNTALGTVLDSGLFDADSLPDVIVATGYDRSILHHLVNNGNRTFSETGFYVLDFVASDLLLRDLNGDGRRDVVVAAPLSDEIAVYWSTAAFSLIPGPRFSTGANPLGLAAGDIDDDGNQDLLAACFDADAVVVHRGLGGGAFGPPEPYTVGNGPRSLVIGDFTGDGRADVLTSDSFDNKVSVLRNRCD